MPRKIKDVLAYFSPGTDRDVRVISLNGVDLAGEEEDQIRQLADSIVAYKGIEEISFRFTDDFTSVHRTKLQPLFDAIKWKEIIRFLDFTHCALGKACVSSGIIELVASVLGKSSLRHVGFCHNFTSENIDSSLPVLRAILTNPYLESFKFGSNALFWLSTDGLHEVFQLLSKSNIKKIFLEYNGFSKLTEDSLNVFGKALSRMSRLEVLYLDGSSADDSLVRNESLSAESILAFVGDILSNGSLRSLSLCYHELGLLGSEGIEKIFSMLNSSSLKELVLIGAALGRAANFTSSDVDEMAIVRSEGERSMASLRMFIGSCTLEKLDIRDNEFSDGDLAILLSSRTGNPHLKLLCHEVRCTSKFVDAPTLIPQSQSLLGRAL